MTSTPALPSSRTALAAALAAMLATPGVQAFEIDTGNPDLSLRWDTTALVDTTRRFVLPLRAVLGPGVTDTPVVDVTPRRVQRFRCLPGERIRWSFGTARGTVTAASDGSVTVPRLRLGADWLPLVLERERG